MSTLLSRRISRPLSRAYPPHLSAPTSFARLHPSPFPTRQLHVRPISILGTATRVSARLAGRGALAVGLGAGAGLGTLSYAENKLQGLKDGASSLFSSTSSLVSSLSTSLGETASSLSTSASSSLSDFSSATSELLQGTSEGFEAQLEALRRRWQDFRTGDAPGQGSSAGAAGGDGGEGGEGQGGKDRPYGRAPAVAAALASSLPIVIDTPAEDHDASADLASQLTGDPTGDLMLLTRKLIEIRTILLSLNEGMEGEGDGLDGMGAREGLELPSIVVIGSQSSGKSSVLEAIVGREFLPKGNNMVTRRPIELTLIHTPPSPANPHPPTYASFPTLGPSQITDFSLVQQTLLDLNLSVPASECVSATPIHLQIHSPSVPDLSLVDLPGYVQISSMDQPEELKEKISNLCDKYIKGPNIILAVCSADVDLANSPALKASKRVDPLGMRTIGVITKMDLVEPEVGGAVLGNDRYPLALGYVGVISKATMVTAGKGGGLLTRREKGTSNTNATTSALSAAIKDKEEAFFYGENRAHFSREGIRVGTDTLKSRLMSVLEESMSSSLSGIINTVSLELEEASYQFKVQYNDRSITPESYLAETMDLLKSKIAELAKGFNKGRVRELLKGEMDETCLDLLAKEYWSNGATGASGGASNGKRSVAELTKLGENSKIRAPASSSSGSATGTGHVKGKGKEDELGDGGYWERELDFVTSRLTKSGVGRQSTQLVVDSLRSQLSSLTSSEPLSFHPESSERLLLTADSILRRLFVDTSKQVENSVKPYKYEIEVGGQEWEEGRVKAVDLLERELGMCERALGKIREAVGSRKLRGVMEYVGELEEKERRKKERMRELRAAANAGGGPLEEQAMQIADDDDPNTPTYNSALLTRAREAMFLSSRSSILKLRIMALKSRRCKNGPEQKTFCPEAFLNVVADKLSHTAVQFINIELLHEFFSQFPRDIDSRLGYDLDPAEVKKFAKENPIVRSHLALQERKEKLELVAGKLDDLVKLQREKAAKDPLRKDASARGGRGLFGMF